MRSAWLHSGVEVKKGDRDFWAANGENTVELVKQLISQKGDTLAAERRKLVALIADILIDAYSADSAVLRAAAAAESGHARAALHQDAARAFVNDAATRIDASARQALSTMAEGDTLRTMLAALRRLLKWSPINATELRRHLADAAVTRKGYIF